MTFLDRLDIPVSLKIQNLSWVWRRSPSLFLTWKVVKQAGPDGFPVDIYKLFKVKRIIPLLDKYIESFEQGYLPLLLWNALITHILKSQNVSPTDQFYFTCSTDSNSPIYWRCLSVLGSVTIIDCLLIHLQKYPQIIWSLTSLSSFTAQDKSPHFHFYFL